MKSNILGLGIWNLGLGFFLILLLSGCNNNKSSKESNVKVDTAMFQTDDNIKYLIFETASANDEYSRFAKRAETEKHNNINKLFIALSKSESIILKNYIDIYKKLGCVYIPSINNIEIKSTNDNLNNSSIKIKTYISDFLLEYIQTANKEKLSNVMGIIMWHYDIENKHYDLINNSIRAISEKKENGLPSQFYICPKCGNIFDGNSTPDYCNICSEAKADFIFLM